MIKVVSADVFLQIKKTPSKSPVKGRRSQRNPAKRRRIIVEEDSDEHDSGNCTLQKPAFLLK